MIRALFFHPGLSALTFRWIHRRAVLGFLLLPWFTLALLLAGLAVIDLFWGDGLIARQWVQEPRRVLLRQIAGDVIQGAGLLHLGGLLPWLVGLLLGRAPRRVSGALLALAWSSIGLGLGLQAGLSLQQPQVPLLASVFALAGLLYALSTHRRPARPQPRRIARPAGPPPPAAPPRRPAPPRAAAPLPILTDRHEAPTTVPAEF
jgi:hypothetical protein